MATERNPYDRIEGDNIIQLNIEEETTGGGSIEVDPVTGEITVDLMPEETEIEVEVDVDTGFYENLAEQLDDDRLQEIGNTVIDKFEADKDSRAEWESMFERGFDLLGLKLEDTTEPFEGAATAVHPLLIESAVKFQAKASQELFPSGGPVKAQVMGSPTLEKQQQAQRVQNFMNYQLTDQMPEYFDEFERMLFHLPLIGSAIKKIYYDASLERPVSEFVPIDQFYVSYYATDLRRADRYTHVIYRSPTELYRQIEAGMYADIELPDAGIPSMSGMASKMDNVLGLSPSGDDDPQYVLYEQHCYLELPEDKMHSGKVACPYIVTVEEQSGQVLAIRRNWNEGDKKYEKKMHFTHYRYVPGFGFYGLGLIHFLGNLTMSATAAMRSLLDAGQFANLPGGFKAKGVRIVGDNDPIAPGEFKEVEATGIDLSKAIVPLPFKEPSQTLFNMLTFVAGAGQKFADSTEQVISDSGGYGPVGTTMALLEASSKFFSAIHKRLHKSQKDEFRILAQIDYDYLPNKYPYQVPFEDRDIFKADFDGRVDIIPVSDPNIPSNAHRMMLANMALQMAQQSPPGMFNIEELNRTILNAANMPNLEQILPPKIEPQPLDPVSDIMAVTKGLPIAAFPSQNHDAHIQVKMMYLQDPQNGANPIMARIKPVLESNIQEHSVLKYQEQMNGVTSQMLQQVPPEQQGQSTVVEMAMAQAAQQVMQANQQPPVPTPEQQLVALEQEKVKLQQQKLQSDTMVNAAELELKTKELDLKENEQILDMLESGATDNFKREKAEADREAKKELSAMNNLAKLEVERMKDEKDTENTKINTLSRVAIEEMKKGDS